MGEGYPGVGRRTHGGGYPGHHLERDSVLGQSQGLFAAPSEDEGVSPLEPDHQFALGSSLHQQAVDLGLGQGLAPSLLANKHPLGGVAHRFQQ